MLVQEQPQVGQDVFTFLALEQVELVDAGDGQTGCWRIVEIMGRNTCPQLLGLAIAADEDAGLEALFRRQLAQFLENPAAFIEKGIGLVDDDGVAWDGGCGLARLGVDVVDTWPKR